VQQRRRAETRRFGAPVYAILAGGFVGVVAAARWYAQNRASEWRPKPATLVDRLQPSDRVTEQRQVELLLSDVRTVLERFGVSLGAHPLRVRLLSEGHALEGTTTKVLRPPPVLRGVEALSLRRGLTAIAAAQVLAHEYTHAWLWLQGFPALEPRLEEGLCELLSYLYLLSCLRQPEDEAGVLARDPAALREHILQIEGKPRRAHARAACCHSRARAFALWQPMRTRIMAAAFVTASRRCEDGPCMSCSGM
jgi:hypothetical protein